MKKFLIILVLLGSRTSIGQTPRFITTNPGYIGINTNSPVSFLTVENNDPDGTAGDLRTLFSIHNKSNFFNSFAGLEIMAGVPSSKTVLQHVSSTYNIPGFLEYADFGQLYSRGSGLILRSGSNENPYGIIKLMTGNNSGGSIERMRIDWRGNVGIGTQTPQQPLTVSSNAIPYSELSIGFSNTPHNGTYAKSGHHIYGNRDIVFNVNSTNISNLPYNGRAYTFRTIADTYYSNSSTLLTINMNGNVGIGNFDVAGQANQEPGAKLHVKGQDVYVDSVASGMILRSPNGNCWRITVNDGGFISTTQIVCP